MRYVYNETNGGELYFDISDVKLEYGIEEYNHLLYFPLTSYVKLKKRKDSPHDLNWRNILGVVNDFFGTCSDEDKSAIARAIITMHGVLRHDLDNLVSEDNRKEIITIVRELGGVLLELEMEVGLADKLLAFAYENIHLGNFKNAGKRPQDTPELTFYENEVAELTVITIMCKILMPIFSVFMHSVKSYLDTQVKERHCATIMTKFIKHKYHKLFNKLQNYIVHNVSSKFSETTGAIFHAKTSPSLSQFLVDNLLVRNLVNVNLYFKDGNLMTYILVTTKKSVDTQEFNIRSHSVLEKNPSFDDDEEGNRSQFEQDTVMSSKKTYDVYGLVKHSVNRKIIDLLTYYHLDEKEYKKNCEYYTENIFMANDYNIFMNCMFFGRILGGAQSISLLEYNEFMKITVLLQMITAITQHHAVAHLLTATTTKSTTISAEQENIKLKLSYMESRSYQNCRNRYEHSVFCIGGKKWDDVMDALVNSLITLPFVYNTSKHITKATTGRETGLNNKKFPIPESIIHETCSFIERTCDI